MSQRAIQLSLIGTVLLGLFVGIYLAANKRSAKPDPADKIIKHSVDTPAEETLEYWTEEKMRKAKPATMPHVNAPKPSKEHPQRPSQS